MNSHQEWGNTASHWSTAAIQIDTKALAAKLYFVMEPFRCLFMDFPVWYTTIDTQAKTANEIGWKVKTEKQKLEFRNF